MKFSGVACVSLTHKWLWEKEGNECGGLWEIKGSNSIQCNASEDVEKRAQSQEPISLQFLSINKYSTNGRRRAALVGMFLVLIRRIATQGSILNSSTGSRADSVVSAVVSVSTWSGLLLAHKK